MKTHQPIIAAGPHPTGETEQLRGFTGKRKSQDAEGNPVNEYYYRGRRWYGPSNALGVK